MDSLFFMSNGLYYKCLIALLKHYPLSQSMKIGLREMRHYSWTFDTRVEYES
jgi:hypothetical protein